VIALKTAREWGAKAPHLFWGIPGEEWTEQDYLLAQAYSLLEMSRCRCGCGGWADECTNPDLQDEWEGRIGYHFRRATLDRFQDDHKDELKDPGAYAYLIDLRKPDPEE